MIPGKEDILKCVYFKTSRSGGKGGQNVNKVSSKVELVFHIPSAGFLTDEEKDILLKKLHKRLDSDFNIHVVSQEDRSQLMNKERTIVKLISLIKFALTIQKKRVPTRIPKGVIKKRLANKHLIATKKEYRKKPVQEQFSS
ncbi:MAG: alternative ribosome rescue aminoacyl-tRNA hydrolase ArfB [Bacteroidota bacterium]